jgi:hypothetical protein
MEARLKEGFKSSKFLPVEIDGVTKALADWSTDSGVSYTVLKTRFGRGVRGSALLKEPRGYCSLGVTKPDNVLKQCSALFVFVLNDGTL